MLRFKSQRKRIGTSRLRQRRRLNSRKSEISYRMVARRIFRIKPSYPAKRWKNLEIGTDDACAAGFGPGRAHKWLFNKKKTLLPGLRGRKGLSHSPRRQRATGWSGTRCGRFVTLRVRPSANSAWTRFSLIWSRAYGDAKYGEQSQGIGGTAEAHPV